MLKNWEGLHQSQAGFICAKEDGGNGGDDEFLFERWICDLQGMEEIINLRCSSNWAWVELCVSTSKALSPVHTGP